MAKATKSSVNKGSKGSVRIISGLYRGRKLPVLLAEGLRPTTDRIKETVFNWLMPYVRDAKALDCFAGSGSLGFEALSRGAENITFIEMNKAAANQIKQNIDLLKATNAQIIHGDCLSHLKQAKQTFDLVFIDPPFRQGLVVECAKQLELTESLADKAIIYLECEQELADIDLPSHWQLLKQKQAGQVSYRLYQRG